MKWLSEAPSRRSDIVLLRSCLECVRLEAVIECQVVTMKVGRSWEPWQDEKMPHSDARSGILPAHVALNPCILNLNDGC